MRVILLKPLPLDVLIFWLSPFTIEFKPLGSRSTTLIILSFSTHNSISGIHLWNINLPKPILMNQIWDRFHSDWIGLTIKLITCKTRECTHSFPFVLLFLITCSTCNRPKAKPNFNQNEVWLKGYCKGK